MFSDFKKKIELIMKDTSGSSHGGTEILLKTASDIYCGAVKIRNSLYDRNISKTVTLPGKVISVGNITAGGTGKTPMTVFLAEKLKKKNIKPVILSRGYGGSASDIGGMVTDGKNITMTPLCSGDEPYLMSLLLDDVPVFVGKKRTRSAMEAYDRFSPDVFILDDGFQHRAVYRDVDILLFDAEHPFGNGFLIPRGEMREPFSNIERGDVFVLTRAVTKNSAVKRFSQFLDKSGASEKIRKTPVFTCTHRPVIRGVVKAGSDSLEPFDEKITDDVFAFSGIAKNDDFCESLKKCGFVVKGSVGFPDHHMFSTTDFENVLNMAELHKASFLATTEKDFVRFRENIDLPYDLFVVGVEIEFSDDEDMFFQTIVSLL